MHINLPDFSRANVLVIGDIMLDRYWHGNTQRISPEAPIPIVHVQSRKACPGGAGNVALNMAALGVHVSLFGICGNDRDADIFMECLNANQVDHQLLRVEGVPTISKLRVVSTHQQLLRLDFEESLSAIDKQALYTACIAKLKQTQALILSDYGKGTLSDPQQLIQQARAVGIPVLVDPKSRDFSIYRGATLITPNSKEFQAVVGYCVDEASLCEKGYALIAQEQLGGLLITRGEQGMTLLQPHQPPLHLPAKAREVFDVTGAGDTVVAWLAACLAAGESLVKATQLANTAAGIAVSKLGAASVTLEEMQRELHHDLAAHLPQAARGSVDESALSSLLLRALAYGETVVVASGHFDRFTPDTLAYCEAAGLQGDRLVVLVDEHDPANCAKFSDAAQRITVMAGLRVVDWATPNPDASALAFLTRLFPDLVVTPQSQTPQTIAYRGGQFVIFAQDKKLNCT